METQYITHFEKQQTNLRSPLVNSRQIPSNFLTARAQSQEIVVGEKPTQVLAISFYSI